MMDEEAATRRRKERMVQWLQGQALHADRPLGGRSERVNQQMNDILNIVRENIQLPTIITPAVEETSRGAHTNTSQTQTHETVPIERYRAALEEKNTLYHANASNLRMVRHLYAQQTSLIKSFQDQMREVGQTLEEVLQENNILKGKNKKGKEKIEAMKKKLKDLEDELDDERQAQMEMEEEV
ncbi:hypothetical protein NQ176_g1725 [Zarea fungicola]|uniref:Uncharacterized protein n=1 Tax=Zarea fungicola TaxID=93591 RepID=A0ACC1NSM7_9HYPO|nr:hypothetical protein NQ176_g1725 [Lecanicillium fungicola]